MPDQLELPLFRRPTPHAGELRHVVLGTRLVAYRLQRRARRRLVIHIDQRGLRVAAGLRTPLTEIEGFLAAHAAWVLRKLDEWHAPQREWILRDGATFPLLGQECRLRLEAGENRVHWHEGVLVVQVRPGADAADLLRRALRERALALFRERAAHFAARLGRPLPRLALSDAQTRWGSCSEQGGIRLSWRLIHAPPRLIDYVIAHEVAHLVEMNHSPRFWQVVARLYPDHGAARAELRRLAVSCPRL